jgi:hypothetical protein
MSVSIISASAEALTDRVVWRPRASCEGIFFLERFSKRRREFLGLCAPPRPLPRPRTGLSDGTHIGMPPGDRVIFQAKHGHAVRDADLQHRDPAFLSGRTCRRLGYRRQLAYS